MNILSNISDIRIKDHLLIFSLILSSFCITTLSAQTTWLANSNNWFDPASWSTNAVPTAADDVSIPSSNGVAPPIIQGNITAVAKSVTIAAGGVLLVDPGASLTIDGSTGNGIGSSGNIVNRGSIIIGSNQPINGNGIRLFDGILQNEGIIEIDNTSGAAFANIGGNCFSQGVGAQIKIGDLGTINGIGLLNRATFTNQAGSRIDIFNSRGLVTQTASADFKNLQGEIRIENTDSDGLLVSGGTYLNEGSTFIFSVINSATNAALRINTGATFTNNPCAILAVDDNIDNFGTIDNQGQINLNTLESHVGGDFTNNGTIEDLFNTLPLTNVTNNGLIIAQTIMDTSASVVPSAFVIGDSSDFIINGVYTDFSLNTLAGTYDPMTNEFVASPDLTYGIHSLALQVEDTTGGCFRTVAWRIDNQFCPCSAEVDNCWVVGGPDDKWTNPNNWCPPQVPTTGDWAELQDGAVVMYDYTGSDTISRINIRGGASLTIPAGLVLNMENDPDCVFCSMIINSGTVTNEGQINLSNGQIRGILSSGLFDNYGSILIDGADLRNLGVPILQNRGTFNNHPNATIDILNTNMGTALENLDIVNSTTVFTNHTDASISIHDIQGIGLEIGRMTFFNNHQDGLIEIYNVANPSDKLIIEQGAEVLWDGVIDIR
jgi:hypothetical protein